MRSLITALIFLAAHTAFPQAYSIDWYTVDGGGGTSEGGIYSISGTAGQPDAGVHSGGVFELDGGFWTVAVEYPRLYVSNTPAGVMIYWDRPALGFVLDEAPLLRTPPPQPW